jgi:hypothetical protein
MIESPARWKRIVSWALLLGVVGGIVVLNAMAFKMEFFDTTVERGFPYAYYRFDQIKPLFSNTVGEYPLWVPLAAIANLLFVLGAIVIVVVIGRRLQGRPIRALLQIRLTTTIILMLVAAVLIGFHFPKDDVPQTRPSIVWTRCDLNVPFFFNPVATFFFQNPKNANTFERVLMGLFYFIDGIVSIIVLVGVGTCSELVPRRRRKAKTT